MFNFDLLFNFDFFELGALAFIVSGFVIQFYYISGGISAAPSKNESLVDTIKNISENTTPIPVPDPTPLPILGPNKSQYVDVGVQTDVTSTWMTIKQWVKDVFSIRSSDISSIGENNVTNWRNNLDSTQSVDLHDSESALTILDNSTTMSELAPSDSASNVYEVVSNAVEGINDAVDYSYIELFGSVVETFTSEATIQAANEALIQANNVGFIGFC